MKTTYKGLKRAKKQGQDHLVQMVLALLFLAEARV